MEDIFAFTNTHYNTRSELRNHFPPTIIGETFSKIEEYRRQFLSPVTLKRIERGSFQLRIVPGIITKLLAIEALVFRYEEKLFWLFGQEIRLADQVYTRYHNLILEQDLEAINDYYHLKMPKTDLDEILSYTRKDELLSAYLEVDAALGLIKPDTPISEVIKKITSRLLGEYHQRSMTIKNKNMINHEAQLYMYYPSERIDEGILALENFLAQADELPPLITLAILISYFIYISPLEKYNQLIACLLAKHLFKRDYELKMIDNIALFSLIAGHKTSLDKYLDEVILSGDITYYVSYFLELVQSELQSKLNNILKYISGLSYSLRPRDITKSISNISLQNSASSIILPNSLDYSPNEYAKELAEKNPSLTEHQCLFISLHHKSGHAYTLKQYQNTTNCSYETARYSLDELVKYRVYQKKKFRKKYIYEFVLKEDSQWN